MTFATKFTCFTGINLLCALALVVSGCGEAREAARHGGAVPVSSEQFYYTSPHTAVSEENRTEFNTEAYDHIVENPFLLSKSNPLSTFSVDVDTASYANLRRFLNRNQLPPAGAVRIEELVNYFDYHYSPPTGDDPFSVHVEVAECPWEESHLLAKIGLKGKEIELENRPLSNLVFLLDVSGSMEDFNKLPLVKSSMKLLLEQLGENDRIAIVVYAGASGLVLPSTSADHRTEILSKLDDLEAGGSTNGGEGIELAYRIAGDNFIRGGVNRVILCTDGDFNVGRTNQSDLVNLIENKAKSGVFLSVLGFGMGNLKDSTMELLADKGNGNYSYIDSMNEAEKVLVEQMSGTLITIAKDVKIQVDFNPAQVQSYRLIGYENRMLRNEDFLDDTKDAGEIGAGHTVTALYELVPVGIESEVAEVEPSKYQQESELSASANTDELLTVRLRYKDPEGLDSKPISLTVKKQDLSLTEASTDFHFASAVAAFGMLLRESKHCGTMTLERVNSIAEQNLGDDPHGYREEFLQLVKKAQLLE
ncbi:von Willebrand factor [Rubinisphaera italica]|uniref:von Willebrand factor n=2 Tax=Rubinisphaera italica TaxID=2527969 RepID=A0A5C5XLT7_9PLAN|nr:von Willebrand factor [Rubinisphaera italica]